MPPQQHSIREVPDRAFACRTARRRFKKQNHRNLVQLLLVTSELSAAAVAELADQELQRVRAARAGNLDPAPAAPFTDPDRAGEGDPSPVCTQPVVAGDRLAPTPAAEPPQPPWDLAREILQESREQSAAVRRLLARSSELAPRRLPPPSDPALVSVAGPSPAPGSRSVESPACEPAETRSTLAEFEQSHPAPGPRPRCSSPTGSTAAVAPRDLAGLLLPDGTSVAQALAARDARIAQLSFEISDRDRRQRFASIGRAAAFVRDPSNQLADPSPGHALPSPGRAPASPRGASSPALHHAGLISRAGRRATGPRARGRQVAAAKAPRCP